MTTSFADLGVPAPLVTVLDAAGITVPTPIQAATLPDSLAGKDLLGRGRTGSGKTYAFSLPVVARLTQSARRPAPKRPRALILAPTRELVSQIQATLEPLAKAAGLSTTTVFGGVGQGPQVSALRRGVDIVLACPGRLEDLIGQGHCDLLAVEITVLDEADHMADLGFLPAVRRLLDRTPKGGQRMLFSATLDNAIDVLVKRFLSQPVVHEADSAQSPVAKMDHHVLHVTRELRLPVLVDLASAPGRTVVFTRTKHGAKALARQLNKNGVPSVELHGNLSQGARTRNMEAFHEGRATTLVATDIAARGIHVDDVALVVHADPPAEHKAYLHRSGRTARAGAAGTVVTLMTDDQRSDVRALTRAAGIRPTTTRLADSSHPVLKELAPGERERPGGLVVVTDGGSNGGGRSGGRGRGNGSRGKSSGQKGRAQGGKGGQQRTQQSASGGAKSGGAKSGGGQGGRRRGGSSSAGSARRRTGSGGGHSAASFSAGMR
ncbi:superfamily II DNA/RNA helicase [Nocardioides thalensis]|uniref:Superfamily II DNA/RNA helicase n=1 Tax=Nocardioides thalensis TaxID=1914755 RepID=A0A853CAL4_9ACTN|nr:DEAD/DEAH box helicase [Nocardioides thalensis]NYJ03682.1 superfamily II DNA/RNA helicase [Nocardioides thalensis]